MTQHGIYSIEEICGVDMNGPANANYLKCRLFPNDLSLKRSDFNLRTYEEYEDNFYDTNSFAYGKQKTIIRRRGDKVVFQRTRDVSDNSHCYEEKSREDHGGHGQISNVFSVTVFNGIAFCLTICSLDMQLCWMI